MKTCFKALIALFSLGSLFGCDASAEKENKELSDKLVGEWRNVSMKINMRSYQNKDTAFTFEVNESNWEDKMNIRTIRTFFRPDRTYNSEHYNLKDSLVYNPAGQWKIIGDTLHMWDTFPRKELSYKYRLVIKDDLAEFFGVEDCDGDGKADDEYYGTQRKQAR